MSWCRVIPSPIGAIRLEASTLGVRSLTIGVSEAPGAVNPLNGSDPPPKAELVLDLAQAQLERYFEGGRTAFTVALDPDGTPWQRRVWQALRAIRFGEAVTYGELAARLGKPGASRAVGAANGANPVPIIVPCHRVIASGGGLGGYTGGLDRKRWLLRHEGVELVRGRVAGAMT